MNPENTSLTPSESRILLHLPLSGGISKTKAELILLLIVMATSSSFLLMKLGADSFAPFNLLTLRFFIAFAATAPFCIKRIRRISTKTVSAGAILGILMFVLIAAQIYGLKTVSTSEAGFLSRMTVVFVPALQVAIYRKLPGKNIIMGAAITMTGVALMTVTPDFTITTGALLYMLSALLYAFHILIADMPEIDALAAGVIEMGMAGIMAFCFTVLFETPRLPANAAEWRVILALGIVCSAFGLAFQPAVQRYTTPERYGLIFGCGPVFSALLGFVFLQETLGIRGFAGAVLILTGFVFSRWKSITEKV